MKRLEVGAVDRRLLAKLGFQGALEGLHEQYEGSLLSLLDSPLKRLLPRFREFLLHVTSPEGFSGIRKCEAILPNDGSFPNTFPQSATSYGRLRNAVSLFDFANPSPQQFVEQFDKVACFFPCHHPATLVLLLSREIAGRGLIDYKQAFREVGLGPMKIPHFEAWLPGSIPLSAVQSVVLIRRNPARLRTFAPSDPRLLDVGALMKSTWPTLEIPLDPKSLSPVEHLKIAFREMWAAPAPRRRRRRRIRRIDVEGRC